MEANGMIECSICFYVGRVGDFTPVTASADAGTLECPRCFNNFREYFEEIVSESTGCEKAA